MSQKLRVAFVGCGEISQRYLPVYRDLDFVRVTACVDTDIEKARQAAAFLSSHQPVASADYGAALADNVDAVIINTPNFLHRAQAEAAFAAGKHVLLQKPLAPILPDARAIVTAAKASRRVTGLYMSYFDQPLVYDLRDMVSAGRLGSVVHFYARLMHRGGMRWSDAALNGNPTWRGSIAQTGGGCFIQLAVHYIHLIEWISGSPVVRATALTGNLHCPGLEGEDLAVAILQLQNGAMVTIDTAWNAVGEQFAIHGTRGGINYRDSRTLSLWSDSGSFSGRVLSYAAGASGAASDVATGSVHEISITPPAMGDIHNPFNQHRMFLEAARDNQPAFVPIASGLHDMEVVMAVYQSAQTGRTVEVAP